jgi:hypothetical protein
VTVALEVIMQVGDKSHEDEENRVAENSPSETNS